MILVLDAEPTEEEAFAIELADMCERLHTLPRAGGILDQDYYQIKTMYAVARGRHLRYEKDHPSSR